MNYRNKSNEVGALPEAEINSPRRLTAPRICHISCSQVKLTEFGRDHSLELAELEQKRNLWLEKRIENYKMTIQINKTGRAAPSGKFIIIVRGGVAKSIKSVDFNPDTEMLYTQIRFGSYDTINSIFNFIENAEKD